MRLSECRPNSNAIIPTSSYDLVKPTKKEIEAAQITALLEKAAKEIEAVFPKHDITTGGYWKRYEISPDIARTLITDEYMPTFQRDVNRDNKRQYIEDIKKGAFDVSTITFAVLRQNGINRFINIDGRTRLNAVAEAGIPLTFNIIFEPYDTIEDVKKAYTKIDIGRKRNFNDKLNALEILEGRDIPKKLKGKLGGIFSIINADFPATYSGKRRGANDDQAKVQAVKNQVENVELYGRMLAPIINKTKTQEPMVDYFLNPGTAAAIIHLMS